MLLKIWKKWLFCVYKKENHHNIVNFNKKLCNNKQKWCIYILYISCSIYSLIQVSSNEPEILQVWSLCSINLVSCDDLTDIVCWVGLSQPTSLLLILQYEISWRHIMLVTSIQHLNTTHAGQCWFIQQGKEAWMEGTGFINWILGQFSMLFGLVGFYRCTNWYPDAVSLCV